MYSTLLGIVRRHRLTKKINDNILKEIQTQSVVIICGLFLIEAAVVENMEQPTEASRTMQTMLERSNTGSD